MQLHKHSLRNSPAAGDAPPQHRILANLERGAAGPLAPDFPARLARIGAALLLLLAGLLGLLLYQTAGTPAAGVPDRGTHALSSGAATPAAGPDSAYGTVPPEPAAAIIISEPAPIAAIAAVQPPSLAAGSALPAAGTSKRLPAPSVAPAAPSRPSGPSRPESPPVSDAGAAPDGDAALLAALVAYAGRQADTPAQPLDAKRDIVQQRAGDTLESLLQRCKQLGLLEGFLCRARICSGRNGDEAVCQPAGGE